MPLRTLKRIVSDGQMGVDRAALDTAKALGLDRAGFTTKGCIAIDGQTDHEYNLKANNSPSTAARNIQIVDSVDATLILTFGPATENMLQISSISKKKEKPVKMVDLNKQNDPDEVAIWLIENKVETLNICGPDDKSRPETYRKSREYLMRAIGRKELEEKELVEE